ncbi:unnamed protein product [Rangifer tarandus platyrhynchus]|uniref:Uncharacterized protein n=1 Tax=Rangifer tarandus platyrhynchus TaxID=3082113 RepID=A0AC59YTG4_RANTA
MRLGLEDLRARREAGGPMSPVPRPAEPHASFRGKEMSEAQRPQHLDTTPEADKIFLEINRGQAVGGSTTSYLRQTAPPPRAPEDPSICPCTRRERGGRTHSRAGVQSAYGQTPSHARPPGGAAARASASTTGTREPEPETQTGPPGTERPTAVPDRAGARGPEVRRSAPAGTPRVALGWETGWRPWAPRSQAGVAGTREMPVTRRGWPARVPGSPPTRSVEPSTLLLRAAAVK